jgi:tetraacyldisaccharide 4'-kinase
MKVLPKIILPPLSAVYSAITRARLSMYRSGTFRSTKLDRPVISVGNITTGGTGKTPLVEWVARRLAQNGKRVCVLTRGYRRSEPGERVLVSDGQTVFSTPQTAGDEAFLLATQLKGIAAVISDANRVAAGEDAIKHLRPDCFVLDDGFQHLRLVRDLDIVTIDATNPWGGGRLLPEGRLREPFSGLSRAGCVVITRVDQAGDVDSLRQRISNYSTCPVFTSRMHTRALVPVNESLETLAEPIGAFCGVGNPKSFFMKLRQEGYALVFERAMPDHHAYTQQDIDSIARAAKDAGAKSLITTAKDAVKLQPTNLSLPCFSLDVEIAIDDAEEFFTLILSRVG